MSDCKELIERKWVTIMCLFWDGGKLNLENGEEIQEIKKKKYLNTEHINTAMALLRIEFPDIGGLDNVHGDTIFLFQSLIKIKRFKLTIPPIIIGSLQRHVSIAFAKKTGK